MRLSDAFPCVQAEVGLPFECADEAWTGKAVDGVLQGAEVQFGRIDAFAFLPNQRAGKVKLVWRRLSLWLPLSSKLAAVKTVG